MHGAYAPDNPLRENNLLRIVMAMKHADLIPYADAPRIAGLLGISVNTVISWRQRKSIPPDRWPALIAAGIATLEDLSPELADVVKSDAA